MYRPSDLHDFLDSIGVSPNKRLSQNFLIDGNIVKKIVDLADIQFGDTVLEIGPGPGALTEQLLKRGAKVIAVEKDKKFAEALLRLDPSGIKLTVFSQDIMDVDIPSLSKVPIKVVANLPYHLTTPIITKIACEHETISLVVVMMQNEVAKRFTSSAGNKDFGSITLFLQYHTHPEFCFVVNQNCFYPKPDVDSAVVKLTLRQPPKVSDEKAFFKLVNHIFTMRRKMLRSSLATIYDKEDVKNALKHLDLDPKYRPEDINLLSFIQLFEKLKDLPRSSG